MLEKIVKYRFKIVAVLFLVALLAGIRAIEGIIFYDPFLLYFKGEFTSTALPKFNTVQLLLSLLIRYFLNSAISLAIIYVIFRELEMLKFATLLYVAFFIVLISILFTLLFLEIPPKMYIFYVRRFLIQPLFLLLFVPAFYFQKLQTPH